MTTATQRISLATLVTVQIDRYPDGLSASWEQDGVLNVARLVGQGDLDAAVEDARRFLASAVASVISGERKVAARSVLKAANLAKDVMWAANSAFAVLPGHTRQLTAGVMWDVAVLPIIADALEEIGEDGLARHFRCLWRDAVELAGGKL